MTESSTRRNTTYWKSRRKKAEQMFSAGVRQSTVARMLGISRQCIHNWFWQWQGGDLSARDRMHRAGAGRRSKLDGDKRARWQQTFVATPLQPGAHPLQLPALQFSANGGPEQKVSWEPLKLEIKTRVSKLDVTEARDRTGIEELPPLPAPRPWCGSFSPARICLAPVSRHRPQ